MRVFRRMHHGNMTVGEEEFELKGMLWGDLIVEAGAAVSLTGMVFGNVVLNGGVLRLTGMVQGKVVQNGGVLEGGGMVGR